MRACITAATCLTLGCEQHMAKQPVHRPLAPSAFFADGQSAREPVPGTIARGHLRLDQHRFAGTQDGTLATTVPLRVTPQLLERGRTQFSIFCTPCHGATGDGSGMIVLRGYPQPPSFHIDRLRDAPVGYFYQVITSGIGAMPPYAPQVAPDDRWAVVAYIRALQLSRHATLADVPPEKRHPLETLAQ